MSGREKETDGEEWQDKCAW